MPGGSVFDVVVMDSPTRSRHRPSSSNRLGWAWAVLAVGLAAVSYFTPQPVRALLGATVAFGWPVLAWSDLVRTRLALSLRAAFGFGVALMLSSWALWELVLIGARAGVNLASSLSALALAGGIPTVLCRGRSSLDARALRRASAAFSAAASAAGRRVAVLVVLVGAGATAVAISMDVARTHPDSQIGFHIFWLGMALMLVPLFVLAVQGGRGMLTLGLLILSAAMYMPVFARSPRSPLMFDELAHWGEAQQMLISQRLFESDSVVGVGPLYPGLETLTVGVHRLTGIPVYSVGSLIILLGHTAAIFAVAHLARVVTGAGDRAAFVGAAIYAIGPSFVRLDAWYAYESLAVPLALALLAAVVEWSTAPRERASMWAVVALGLGAGLVVTHHLTTLSMAVVLLLGALLGARRQWRTDSITGQTMRPGPFAVSGGVLLGAAVIWAVAVSAPLLNYLGVFPRNGAAAVVRIITGQSLGVAADSNDYLGKQTGTRGLFGGSLLPHYEQILGFIAQPLLLVWFLIAIWRLRSTLRGMRLLFALVGFAYFASLPLTLVAGASAGAHRSWATSFIGLAITLPAVLGSRGPAPAHARQSRGRRAAVSETPGRGARVAAAISRRATILVTVTLSVVLVGSYSASASAYEQFPGPFVLNTDGRNVTPDMIRSARWFEATQGRGRIVLTNSRTIAVFGAYAGAQQPSFPAWQIFFPIDSPGPKYIQLLRDKHIEYLIVDKRLATGIPHGRYFNLAEPTPPAAPLPKASITKFDTFSWLARIHTDGNIVIYKVTL